MIVTARGGELHVSGHDLPVEGDASRVTLALQTSHQPHRPASADRTGSVPGSPSHAPLNPIGAGGATAGAGLGGISPFNSSAAIPSLTLSSSVADAATGLTHASPRAAAHAPAHDAPRAGEADGDDGAEGLELSSQSPSQSQHLPPSCLGASADPAHSCSSNRSYDDGDGVHYTHDIRLDLADDFADLLEQGVERERDLSPNFEGAEMQRVQSAERIGGPAVLVRSSICVEEDDDDEAEVDEGAAAANIELSRSRSASSATQPLLNSARRGSSGSAIRVLGRVSHEESAPEAIVYIPGFNANTKGALLNCGQLLALGDFPTHIKCFAYSWPGGRELTYFTAMNVARCERTQLDFAAFISSIIDAGVRDIHILAHSAGAHILLSSLHRLQHMLQSCEQQSQARRSVRSGWGAGGAAPSALPKARIVTCAFMSPDYPLKKFVEDDFEPLRALTSHITLYCDVWDRALMYSQVFNRERALGKNPFRLSKDADSDSPGIKSDQGILYWLATHKGASLEHELESRVRQRGEPLDMDVIDTSWMDSNVQSLRHNYFNVNRWMIDDIRESLVLRRRAHMRMGRLTHRRGNVWSFIGAPKYIVNIS